jgi:MFS family permease
MGFAIFSSVHTPACISLINDMFTHKNRSKANSVYVAAISIGVGFANLTSFINEAFGWRNAILVVTGIGGFITIGLIFLVEPVRTAELGT